MDRDFAVYAQVEPDRGQVALLRAVEAVEHRAMLGHQVEHLAHAIWLDLDQEAVGLHTVQQSGADVAEHEQRDQHDGRAGDRPRDADFVKTRRR
jgi:hypothetical protein